MLYQRCSPAPGFRALLALESVLIIKTWKGAPEAASITAEDRPPSPPLAVRPAWVAGEINRLAACKSISSWGMHWVALI